MRQFGYRLMSGSFAKKNGGRVRVNGAVDPYESMLGHLQYSVFSGPGTLDASVRQAIGAGDKIRGALGSYGSKVAQRDYKGLDECISQLRLESYSDDQIFEATVCAALGAGLKRLRLVLNAVVLCSQPASLRFRRAS